MDRRLFIASAFASPLLVSVSANGAEDQDTPKKGVHVPAGTDRAEEPLKLGKDRVDGKVTSKDTAGLYVFEGVSGTKGGPGLHVHHEQDEWFYVLEGEFRFEVGDEKFTAKVGDSVFGPRKVPHVWARVSNGGRLLMAVQPAGTFEEFFQELAKFPVPTTGNQRRVSERIGRFITRR